MKTALITTTVNVPTILELYRRHGPDVAFFVAGDEKTPHEEVGHLMSSILPAIYLSPAYQRDLGYKCSELIGWNCIQRRNIALLEAIKWGAEIIVSIDDDNLILGDAMMSYFHHFYRAFGDSFGREIRPLLAALKVSSPNGWFDVGQLLDPISPHRGFPIQVDPTRYEVSHAAKARVGVAAGICLGDPDISAVTRIARAPVAHRVSELLQSGIVVDPSTKTVFNSQNTAFIRELAPAMFMMPGVGRHDDIYASLICQRVMRERGLHAHFGKPFVWQQRNPHNLVKDLRQEIDGMENVERFAKMLDHLEFNGLNHMIADVRHIYRNCMEEPYIPKQSVEAALAFLEDIEPLMGATS